MFLIKSDKKPIYALIVRVLGLLISITAVSLQLFTNKLIGKGFMANHVLAAIFSNY